jgi:hypothetical protein
MDVAIISLQKGALFTICGYTDGESVSPGIVEPKLTPIIEAKPPRLLPPF